MEYQTVQVQVSKESYELAKALAKMVIEAKKAGKDGFQLVPDSIAIVTACYQDIMAAVSGIEKIGEEFKMDKAAMTMAFVAVIPEILDALAPAPAPVPVPPPAESV